MLRALLPALAAALAVAAPGPATAEDAKSAECAGAGGEAPSHCLYRSLLPSSGIVADCRSDRDCRIGYYYGRPSDATWFTPPAGMSALPRPTVLWHTATFAETRIGCGRDCAWSYFFEARRRILSAPRRDVLAVDHRRLLMAQVDGRALAIRQIFSGRDVMRLERNWAPGPGLAEAIREIRFGADGRLSLTWLEGPARAPVSERVTVPSFAP